MTDQSNRPALPPRPLAETRPESRNPDPIAELAHAMEPVPVRTRSHGWSPATQVAFIEALAACGCVGEAAARVGMSARSAYILRARPGARSFREAWEVALDSAVDRIADAMFGRALNGVARPVFYQGEQIGERRYYDERLAMFILSRRAPDRYGMWIDRREVRRDHDETGAALGEALARVEQDALLEEAGGDAAPPAPAGDGNPFDPFDPFHPFGEARAAEPDRAPLPRPVYLTERQADERRQVEERRPTEAETNAAIEHMLDMYDYNRSRYPSGGDPAGDDPDEGGNDDGGPGSLWDDGFQDDDVRPDSAGAERSGTYRESCEQMSRGDPPSQGAAYRAAGADRRTSGSGAADSDAQAASASSPSAQSASG